MNEVAISFGSIVLSSFIFYFVNKNLRVKLRSIKGKVKTLKIKVKSLSYL